MIDKKPKLRRSIIQILSITYATGTTESAITDALKGVRLAPSHDELKKEMKYLEAKKCIELKEIGLGKMLVAKLRPYGLDVLHGFVVDPGITAPSQGQNNLPETRDARRGILSVAAEYDGWVSADDFKTEFVALGTYEDLLPAVIKEHLWYLEGKGFVEVDRVSCFGQVNVMAKITATGVDLQEGRTTEIGITG